MTGLEKILDEIRQENAQEIDKINSEAVKIADGIIKEQEEKIENMQQNLNDELEKIKKLDIEKGISSALSHKKKMILKEKQEIITNIIEKSKEYIKNLPKEEYILFLEKIALNYAHKEKGIIRLNKRDKDNIGEELVSRINIKLSENGKGELTLDGELSKEDTGFVIIYDDIEENCSLESIFSEKNEILEDKLNLFLFE